MTSHSKNIFILFFVLAVKTLFLGLFIYSGFIGLGPDEAQYWTWSQQLDVGYYSKPPGIAWEIALGTALFGNTELGVRAGALLIGFLLPFTVYSLARSCVLKPQSCFWAALVMAFSPLGILASVLAITDGGMVFFWALASAVVCKNLSKQEPLNVYFVGFLILCGALFKWPIYLFWLLVIGLMIWQRYLYSHHLFGAIALSLVGIMSSLVWNSQYDWPTFRHVLATVNTQQTADVGTTALLKGNFLEFLGAQALLFSPIFFVCFLIASFAFLKNWKELPLSIRYCGASVLLFWLSFAFLSFFKKMQGNWCDFVYPGSCVLIAWYAKPSWLKAGTVVSLMMVGSLLFFPQAFKHNLGWDQLESILIQHGYDPELEFLFADKYQVTSELSFYAPQQKRAYFFNLQNMRKNQFSYWPGMEKKQLGKDGFFVAIERDRNKAIEERYQKALEPYFQEVHFLGAHPLVMWKDKPYKTAYIFKGVGYNGKLPLTSTTY